eukprot:c20712_g1_i1 orf=110-673(+)
MATSQFYSVCLAHESIRACRALLLASPCPSSRAFLHTQTKLRFPQSSFHGLHRPSGPSPFACRAFSAIGSSSRRGKSAETPQNPREEIRKLDEEIRRLERERRSVGKEKNSGVSGAGEKAVYGGRKGNASNDDLSDRAGNKPRYGKPAGTGRSAKLAASAGSSRNANARAMARFAQEEVEEEEEEDD